MRYKSSINNHPPAYVSPITMLVEVNGRGRESIMLYTASENNSQPYPPHPTPLPPPYPLHPSPPQPPPPKRS
jgi:hypothetical protein